MEIEASGFLISKESLGGRRKSLGKEKTLAFLLGRTEVFPDLIIEFVILGIPVPVGFVVEFLFLGEDFLFGFLCAHAGVIKIK